MALLSRLSEEERIALLRALGGDEITDDPIQQESGALLFTGEGSVIQAWTLEADWGQFAGDAVKTWLEREARALLGESEAIAGCSWESAPPRWLYWGDDPDAMRAQFPEQVFHSSALDGKTFLVS